MITPGTGNLLTADADALVNTVNTVGVMGKGIALQFRRAFPDMFKDYQKAVKNGDVQLGKMHVWKTGQMTGPRFIINFPTKGHWRSRSKLKDISAGLIDLVRVIDEYQIRSLAIPPLGCGNGGLDWRDVEPLIRRALEPFQDTDVLLYAPEGAPTAAQMPTAEKRPSMTPGRAALIAILDEYAKSAMANATLIESQKLMYFLQEAGEPLRLNYVPHRYGPYADNLRHVLRVVEGQYLSGYGDGSAPVLSAEPLEVLPGAPAAAEEILDEHPETNRRIRRVMELTEGFETAYGLELLASVHWVSKTDHEAAANPDRAVQDVQKWTDRKARMFTPEHIRTAWQVLHDRGWVGPEMAATST